MNDFNAFDQLIQRGHPCISIVTHEERYALEIIQKTARKLNRDMWVWSLAGGVRDGHLEGSPFIPDTESPAAGIAAFEKAKSASLCVALDLGEHLKGGRCLRLLRDMINNFDKTNITLVLLDHVDQCPDAVKAHSHLFELSYPDEDELQEIVKATLMLLHRKNPIEIGISPRGLDTIVRNLRGLTRRQAARIIKEIVVDMKRFTDEDINQVIAGKRRIVQRDGLLEYIQTPLDLDEIGGMNALKAWLRQRSDSLTPEAKAFGLRPPKGLLLLGVQGAGKSLCAKAIATAWHLPLLRMDPGALYNSYIGKSEHNLREALRQTEMMAPVILWIDEIKKAFASAASHSADGGLSQRMFGTLLTWLQEREEPVFVAATANDIEALPPELLRKGRFDEIFYVDLPEAKVREEIFAIHIKKQHRDPANFDLSALAAASHDYSGAEIEQAVIAALHAAYADKTDLDTHRLISTLRQSPPLSTTMAEKVSAFRSWAKGRCMPAG